MSFDVVKALGGVEVLLIHEHDVVFDVLVDSFLELLQTLLPCLMRSFEVLDVDLEASDDLLVGSVALLEHVYAVLLKRNLHLLPNVLHIGGVGVEGFL